MTEIYRVPTVGEDGTIGGEGGTPLTSEVVSASASGGIPAWAADTPYPLNALVTDTGNTYICRVDHTSGSTFSAESSDWQVLGAQLNQPNTWTGLQTFSDIALAGKVGATADLNFAGATVSGAPTSGTFDAGDAVLSLADGKWYVCTVTGTPGTWVTPGGGASAPLILTGSSDTQQLVVKANATQTTNLQEWQDHTGLALTQLEPDGSLHFNEYSVGLRFVSRFATITDDAANGIQCATNGAPTALRIKAGSGGVVSGAGLGAFGVSPPSSQPAAPVTLADVIAILQGAGLCS